MFFECHFSEKRRKSKIMVVCKGKKKNITLLPCVDKHPKKELLHIIMIGGSVGFSMDFIQ